MCTYLSSYRLFTDVPGQLADPALRAYDLATPLFSDYADKLRWIFLPPGTAMTWSDDGAFAMPVGTVIVKTFAYPVDARDPSLGRRLLETRLLIHRADGWEGATYVHDEALGDAVLSSGARTLDVTWIDGDGQARTNAYVTPSRNQCRNCHEETVDVLAPIGPKARHLNHDGQLAALVDDGLVEGAPPEDQWPAVAPLDGDAPVAERARGWLDINCGHCHNPLGAARTSGLDLRLANDDPFSFGVCKPPVAAGQGSGGRAWDVVPGEPDQSILVYRIEATEADVKMPELGRNLVHAEGVAAVRAWIAGLDGDCGS
ncbi:MAG: SO2930 family diheme c-type cytochrome [Kofleriaceae bacterium]